jgi:hypothetical protein
MFSLLSGVPETNPAGPEVLDFAIVSNILPCHSFRMSGSLSTFDYNTDFLATCDPLAADKIKPTFIYSDANWENYLINNKYPLLRRKLIKE